MTNVAERARNRLVSLPGHFSTPVRIETVELIGDGILLLRVRGEDGLPDETTISDQELEVALEAAQPTSTAVDARDFFRWIESHRIRLAYAHDPYFAVSLSGVRGLPHQIEAVYRHLLPQPRLRFVLADDPGAGKTIMAGLLHKELRLRGVVDRTLVICPAPLTIQWQDELFEKFDERFEVISSHQVRWQLGGNAWQQYHQAITSLDFAKQEDVLPELLRAEWDLIVIDEAHKCSAVSDGDGVRRTKRYVLAEEISKRTERMLLLTATPHSGDEDRFKHFLRLLDPDQFATPDLVKRQIAQENNPYFLRRQKEDLIDEKGRPLFVPRNVVTQPFTLSHPEKTLYDIVTSYVNEYLGASTPGSRGSAVALARTVLQRRLASSLGAIRSSLQKRADRLEERIEELVRLSPAERTKRLIELRVLAATDEETDYDDSDEDAQEEAAIGVSAAEHIEDLRKEVQVLRGLVRKADETIAQGEERKLGALRECLNKSELQELQDGRGKLLIFTEHRDTLDYLVKHLTEWGYSVCSIHGGNPPQLRKQIQHEFRTKRQICVATEAAGEGINLQFCHLMINYDLPWNPVRLEQRMGRIHRIGQQSEVHVFNFVATNTVEGRLLDRLHEKLAEMREALQGRVYDVIGDLLQLNGIDFERLVRDTLANPRRLEHSLEEIGSLSPEVLKRYERDIGIAQATRHVNLDWVRERDWLSEERRLMPEYVQDFFLDAATQVKVRVEQRADGLYRIEHVPVRVRSDDLASVRRLGRPDSDYRKLTFHKEIRERAEHEDAVLLSPGHPLFAATTEALERELLALSVNGGVATFIDPSTSGPYRLHYLTQEVVGEAIGGGTETAYAELVCVLEEQDGTLHLASADILHDLTPAETDGEGPSPDVIKGVTNWIRVNVQTKAITEERLRRREQADIRASYLEEAMEVQRKRLEGRWAEYDQKVYEGQEQFQLPRDEALRRMEELKRRKDAKLTGLARLGVVRGGPVTYLGTVAVAPPAQPDDPSVSTMRRDPETERAAMEFVMAYEREQGRDPEDVSERRDGSGFDIRSVGDLDPQSGDLEVRRIEVKGRSADSGDVGLYRTEWYAAERFREGFWLYVVYSAKSEEPRLVTIQDPWSRLRNVEEIRQITGIRVPGASIEEAAE